jgi:hypothetical protein
MFSKQPKDTNQAENSELKDIIKNTETTLKEMENNTPNTPENKPELVNSVEKISGIVSPYFIVLVGLILSDDNFFFGTILIIIGILSLLKVTTKDINKVFDWLKNFFSGDSN